MQKQQQHATAQQTMAEPTPHQQEIKLYPVDEGIQDPSFKAFREKLLEAARKRDADFVLTILDPHILNSFGGDGGIEEFKKQWKLDQPDSSKLWKELADILSKGGSFLDFDGKREFCAPYVSSQWEKVANQLPSGKDGIDYAAVVGENVDLRLEPNPTAPVIDTLSYNIVRIDYDASVPDERDTDYFAWIKVTTTSGKQGYVAGKYVSSPTAFRACFKKVGEKWFMTSLVAGD
jgi:hypothetical protein